MSFNLVDIVIVLVVLVGIGLVVKKLMKGDSCCGCSAQDSCSSDSCSCSSVDKIVKDMENKLDSKKNNS